MKRRNATRNALFTSIISLLLCVSMLVGTTFAWFTDEVVSGVNTIAAGNLDVELLADGVEVEPSTELFKLDDPNLWEPGMVAYENLQVANVGTLALKYQMTLNFGKENNLNGHKLSEVLKIVVLDEAIDSNMTRVQVLEKAKAAAEKKIGETETIGYGALSNFYVTGELEAETETEAFAVVIYWEPNDNEKDNLYNVNNGQVTSDGEPLHIEFGINLQATQKMSEEDSFGKDYDEFASILPKATVNNLGPQTVTATTSFPNGSDAKEYDMDVTFQFLPNETEEEAESSAYRYWHADYVIKADKDVPANSMALAGYYAAFCKDYNNDNWVLLSSDAVIPAGTEIRLVETLGATVNYEEICQFGNDGVGFQCGAVDLTGENAGTTITVELRLYETTKAPDATSGTANEEVGPDAYEIVDTYSYTFGEATQTVKRVRNAEEMQEALDNAADGDVIALAADIEGNVTATQKPNVKVTINGCDHDFKGTLTVDGKSARYETAGLTILDVNFVAESLEADAYINLGNGDTNTRYTNYVTVKNCTFTYTGTDDKVAIKSYTGGDRNLIIDGCVVNAGMHSMLQVTNVETGLKIVDCKVNSKNGINLNNTPYLDMSGCEFDTVGYCVRIGVNGSTNSGDFTIANSTLKSANDDGDAVIILRGTMTEATVNISGTTLTGTPDITGTANITK